MAITTTTAPTSKFVAYVIKSRNQFALVSCFSLITHFLYSKGDGQTGSISGRFRLIRLLILKTYLSTYLFERADWYICSMCKNTSFVYGKQIINCLLPFYVGFQLRQVENDAQHQFLQSKSENLPLLDGLLVYLDFFELSKREPVLGLLMPSRRRGRKTSMTHFLLQILSVPCSEGNPSLFN